MLLGAEPPEAYFTMLLRRFEGYLSPLIPIKANIRDLQAAIRAVGLTPQAQNSHFYLDNFLLIIYKYIVAT